LSDEQARYVLRIKAEDMVHIGYGVEVENLHFSIANAELL
jgi:hypothetical protein